MQNKKLFTTTSSSTQPSKFSVIDNMGKSGKTEKLKRAVEHSRVKEKIYAKCEACRQHQILKLRDTILWCHGCWAINLTGGKLPVALPTDAVGTSSASGPASTTTPSPAAGTSSASGPATTTSTLPAATKVVKVDLNDDVKVEDDAPVTATASSGASSAASSLAKPVTAATASSGASSADSSVAKPVTAETKAKAKGKQKTNKKPEDGHLTRNDL
jgi:ribosomal protein L37AE/L43A